MKNIKILPLHTPTVEESVQYVPEGASINADLRDQNEPASAFTISEKAHVGISANLRESEGGHTFQCTLNNATSKTISAITFRIVAKNDRAKEVWNRLFKRTVIISPSSSGEISFRLTDMQEVSSLSWTLEEVRGKVE